MKRLPRIAFALIISTIFLPLSALGQDRTFYTTLKAGAYFPAGDLDDDFDFETGVNVEITFGNHFTPNLAIEWGVGFFQSESTRSGSFTDPLLGTLSGTADMDLRIIPIILTPKGYYCTDNLELYGGAGFGVYFVNLEFDASGMISGPSGTTTGFISEDDDDTLFGGHVVAGAHYYLASNISFGVEGKYIFTEEAEFFDVDFSDLNGFIATANIGFRY